MARSSTSWKPGHSGNINGRKRLSEQFSEIREAAMMGTAGAIRYLIRVYENEEEQTRNRILAANAVLDRAIGKPAQAIAFTDSSTPGDNRPLTLEQSKVLYEVAKQVREAQQKKAKKNEEKN